MARAKLESRLQNIDSDIAIASDTVILSDERIIGKPASKDMAISILKDLSGQWHIVASGYAVHVDGMIYTGLEETKVKFRKLDDWLIDRYISTGEPMDKAGGYGIQSLGSLLVEGIEGDFFNVVGLPLLRIEEVLEEHGYTLMPGDGIER